MDFEQLAERNPAVRALLDSLPPRLLAASRLITAGTGQVFLLRGAPVEYGYLLLEGEMYVFNETPDGKASYWMTMRAPTSISDTEVLSGQETYIANVSAVTKCTLLCCPIADFVSLLRTDIDFLWTISTMLAHKNFDLSYGRGHAAFRSSQEKTMLYLLQYCAQCPPKEQFPTVVHKTRSAMAGEIILSQKTVDRCLNQLQEEGYISIVKGKVSINAEQYRALSDAWDSLI